MVGVALEAEKLFEHVPHPHRHRPLTHDEVAQQKLAGGWAGKVNAYLGLHITNVVGTMWCAYAFALLALVSLPSTLKTGNVVTIVAWVAQTFLQLVLLSIIIVGQNIMAEASDKRAQSTYDDAEALLHEALQVQAHLDAQDAEIRKQADALALLLKQTKPPARARRAPVSTK